MVDIRVSARTLDVGQLELIYELVGLHSDSHIKLCNTPLHKPFLLMKNTFQKGSADYVVDVRTPPSVGPEPTTWDQATNLDETSRDSAEKKQGSHSRERANAIRGYP